MGLNIITKYRFPKHTDITKVYVNAIIDVLSWKIVNNLWVLIVLWSIKHTRIYHCLKGFVPIPTTKRYS